MAKKLVFSVLDSKVGLFAQPFFMRSKGEALRAWVDNVNDKESPMSRHPGDFALMELGEYDEETGQFTNLQAPVNLGLATQYLKPAESPAPLLEAMKGGR